MDIGQAVKEMKAGKKVRRPTWSPGLHCVYEHGDLLFQPGTARAVFAACNVLATDYEVLGTTFEEALAAWKAGKRIRRQAWSSCNSWFGSYTGLLSGTDLMATDWVIENG